MAYVLESSLRSHALPDLGGMIIAILVASYLAFATIGRSASVNRHRYEF